MKRDNNQKGFTLIEISIVLVIVGMLVGAIIKGETMIENMRIKQTVKQWDDVKSAWMGFYGKFNALPGDFERATEFLPGDSRDIYNGNGDNVISRKVMVRDGNGAQKRWFEFRFPWNHLDASGFLAGIDQSSSKLSDAEADSLGLPHGSLDPEANRIGKLNAKFPNAEFYIMTDTTPEGENEIVAGGAMVIKRNPFHVPRKTVGDNGFVDDDGHYMFLAKRTSQHTKSDLNYRWMEPVINGRVAALIDRKYDNDDYKSGQIYYFCNMEEYFSSGDANLLTDVLGEEETCRMQFIISKAR